MAAATAHIRNNRGATVAPAPQVQDDSSGMTPEQAERLRQAEEDAEGLEAERTIGVYEEKKQKIGKITKKPDHIIDPRTSKLIPYWDAIGMVRCRRPPPRAWAAHAAVSQRTAPRPRRPWASSRHRPSTRPDAHRRGRRALRCATAVCSRLHCDRDVC